MVTTVVRPPTTPGQVYKCLGCRPKCGRCARSISLIMDEALGCSRAGLGQEVRASSTQVRHQMATIPPIGCPPASLALSGAILE